jgi:hypothetical protein
MLSEKCSHELRGTSSLRSRYKSMAGREIPFIRAHNSAVIRGLAKQRATSPASDLIRRTEEIAEFGLKKN